MVRASPDLTGRVCVVTGASRGIGRCCALALSKRGASVVLIAKSAGAVVKGAEGLLSGTVDTVADEIRRAHGTPVLPLQCDLRSEQDIVEAVKKAVKAFGAIHILVNNASALWWQDIEDTPTKKFDLIHSINARGAFLMTRECLPHMKRAKYGRVVCMAPPIVSRHSAFSQKTAYYMSKMGMTMVALGVAAEGRGHNVTAHSLWPATIVESFASKNFQLGSSKSQWRKADILADCVVYLAGEPSDYTGNMLIDDEYLVGRCGYTQSDLARYRFDPTVEPPRLLALEASGHNPNWHSDDVTLRRGDVRKVREDQARSKL
ncbi:hypothetical protein PPROV_000089600 [Pycnococcus provasolii]|uniref:Uncharacterized protein n=2 Tax=Pycnococcus provasolii TaxID=41880 RepID=A0A830H7Y9_9CHLO|nr:hypothetical protein PPROV_000089600 [Pycnococcus provasolii]